MGTPNRSSWSSVSGVFAWWSKWGGISISATGGGSIDSMIHWNWLYVSGVRFPFASIILEYLTFNVIQHFTKRLPHSTPRIVLAHMQIYALFINSYSWFFILCVFEMFVSSFSNVLTRCVFLYSEQIIKIWLKPEWRTFFPFVTHDTNKDIEFLK